MNTHVSVASFSNAEIHFGFNQPSAKQSLPIITFDIVAFISLFCETTFLKTAVCWCSLKNEVYNNIHLMYGPKGNS